MKLISVVEDEHINKDATVIVWLWENESLYPNNGLHISTKPIYEILSAHEVFNLLRNSIVNIEDELFNNYFKKY